MKTLILLRHSKAVTETGTGDHARALSQRGRAEARQAGEAIIRLGAPDFALVSDARRTRETFDQIVQTIGRDIPHRFEPKLYGADASTISALIAEAPAKPNSLLVLGHNPGIGELARSLAVAGSRKLRHELAAGFPTSALALIRLPGDEWAAVTDGGTLEQFAMAASSDAAS